VLGSSEQGRATVNIARVDWRTVSEKQGDQTEPTRARRVGQWHSTKPIACQNRGARRNQSARQILAAIVGRREQR